MKYVRMWAETPYAGTEEVMYLEVPDNITEEELNEQSDAMSCENAGDFSYLATGWDDDFEDDDERDNYFNDCLEYGGWEFISKEEYLRENCD